MQPHLDGESRQNRLPLIHSRPHSYSLDVCPSTTTTSVCCPYITSRYSIHKKITRHTVVDQDTIGVSQTVWPTPSQGGGMLGGNCYIFVKGRASACMNDVIFKNCSTSTCKRWTTKTKETTSLSRLLLEDSTTIFMFMNEKS